MASENLDLGLGVCASLRKAQDTYQGKPIGELNL